LILSLVIGAVAFVDATEVTGFELAERYQQTEMKSSIDLFFFGLDLLP
jgi:hypothetical protein